MSPIEIQTSSLWKFFAQSKLRGGPAAGVAQSPEVEIESPSNRDVEVVSQDGDVAVALDLVLDRVGLADQRRDRPVAVAWPGATTPAVDVIPILSCCFADHLPQLVQLHWLPLVGVGTGSV